MDENLTSLINFMRNLESDLSKGALEKVRTRENLVANNSRELQVHYVYANLLGLENGRLIYDGGNLITKILPIRPYIYATNLNNPDAIQNLMDSGKI